MQMIGSLSQAPFIWDSQILCFIILVQDCPDKTAIYTKVEYPGNPLLLHTATTSAAGGSCSARNSRSCVCGKAMVLARMPFRFFFDGPDFCFSAMAAPNTPANLPPEVKHQFLWHEIFWHGKALRFSSWHAWAMVGCRPP